MNFKNNITTLVVAAAAAFFIGSQNNVEAAKMVDVSNHNGYMTVANFKDMRDNYDVKSVTTKISEGTFYKDHTAANNIQVAQQAGLYINGYHFCRYKTVQQAKDEADFACLTAKAAGLPVGSVMVADAEASEQGGLSKTQNDANNKAFCEVVELYGYRPDVYTMASWVNKKMTVAKGWVAHYPTNAEDKSWYNQHHAWQYSSSQKFNGSYGNFDISKLYDTHYTGGQTPISDSDTINNVVQVNTWNGNATPMFNSNGGAYDTTPLTSGSKWVGDSIIDVNGVPAFMIGNNEYVLQHNTTLSGVVTINYVKGYGVNALDADGNQIYGTNTKFKAGTKWLTADKLYSLPNNVLAYKVSSTEYIPVTYQVGGGFTG